MLNQQTLFNSVKTEILFVINISIITNIIIIMTMIIFIDSYIILIYKYFDCI